MNFKKFVFRFLFSIPLSSNSLKVLAARLLGVRVGKNTRIYSYCFGSEPFLVSIGSKCTISSNVVFLTHDGATSLVHDPVTGMRYCRYDSICIGNNVFVGFGTVILPGVSIGNDCIIGAFSVLTKSVPSNSVYAGNPARKISSFNEYESKVMKNYPVKLPRKKNESYHNYIKRHFI